LFARLPESGRAFVAKFYTTSEQLATLAAKAKPGLLIVYNSSTSAAQHGNVAIPTPILRAELQIPEGTERANQANSDRDSGRQGCLVRAPKVDQQWTKAHARRDSN